MIYLKNTSTPQMVFIPKYRETEGSLVFSIKNTINQSTCVDDNVIDLQSDLYIQFLVELPADIASGEYEYILLDNTGIVSTGLLIVGESSKPTEYNKTIEYEQYQ